VTLEQQLDGLYKLPLTQFVEARNDLAASLRKSGDSAAAKRVRELKKPSASAWAVNQLYWTARPRIDELIAASDRYRLAQRAALAGDGSELGDAERDRRRAIDEAFKTAGRILGESDPTSTLMRRIQTTLEALASYGSDNPNPLNGRLTEDLDAPGFGALSSLAPAEAPPSKTASRKDRESTKKDEEALAAARVTLAKATARAELQTAAFDQARQALTRAAEEASRAEAQVEEARAAVAKLEKALRLRSSDSGEAAD
jgi:hypothetical protein